MSDNQIIVGAQRQAELEAAKAAFFLSGGIVTALESYSYKPLPFRRHPEPSKKAKKGIQQGARQEHCNERAAMVARMAKTMTCREVSHALGISQNTLWTMAQREDFKFVPGGQGKRTTPYTDAAADAKLAERIIDLRDTGLSRHQVEKQIGIAYGTLVRIIKAFQIDFPKRGEHRGDQ
ncbi:hypothetical protein D3C77_290130 [compost metagenome]